MTNTGTESNFQVLIELNYTDYIYNHVIIKLDINNEK